jgi:hypothetical protein
VVSCIQPAEQLRPFRDATDDTILNYVWPGDNCNGVPASQTKRSFFTSPSKSILDAMFALRHQSPQTELAVIFQRRGRGGIKNADLSY